MSEKNLREDELITLKQFCNRYPWPSEAAMRAYIFRAKELGLSEVFLRYGKRVLIKHHKFFKIIEKVGKKCS